MPRKTVRIDIPLGRPDVMILLAKKICSQHAAAGDKSPLDAAKLSVLQQVIEVAEEKHLAALAHDAQAQSARQTRDQSLGFAEGQTAYSPNTALNIVTYARNQLLLTLEGDEKALGDYGFDVVIGLAKLPQRAAKEQSVK